MFCCKKLIYTFFIIDIILLTRYYKMSGYTVTGPQVRFCKEYLCCGFHVAKAIENTTMVITSVAGSVYAGCSQYVVFPKGRMYCQSCFSWKQLDTCNRAWTITDKINLFEPYLVCEECSTDAQAQSKCQAVCATVHACNLHVTKPKHSNIQKMYERVRHVLVKNNEYTALD